MISNPEYYTFIRRTNSIIDLLLSARMPRESSIQWHIIDSLLDSAFGIFLKRVKDLKYKINLTNIEYHEWFIVNYPQYVDIVINLNSDIKKKYSQIVMAGKFGVFVDD